ncbi:3-keto-5-aminohexanoate cleavage enzyme [bacterium MnTg02]|nr:3-keto-5-aminohexanoate cleavage enzyme [bacterium MnTg02]
MDPQPDIAESVIIMAAVNGARPRKSDNPALPITPEEIAAEAARCHDKGASAVHVHVRDDQEHHILDAERYRRTIGEIEQLAGYGLMIQATTEAQGIYSPEEQIALVKSLQPEWASVVVTELLPDPNDETQFAEFLNWAYEQGIWIQFILYKPEDLSLFGELQQRGIIPYHNPSVLFVLGRNNNNQQSMPEDLDAYLDRLDGTQDVVWMMCAFGKRENDCVRYAIERNGHVRVGFENNMRLPNGKLAPSNAALVSLAAEEAKAAGRPIMTAAGLRLLKSRSFQL